MIKINKPKIGEYVLVTKWGDKDPRDPWYISYVSEIIINEKNTNYKVIGSDRLWANIFRITKEEGKEWIDECGDL
jgi:hypothetical protein